MLVKGKKFNLDVRTGSCCIYDKETLECAWSSDLDNWEDKGRLTAQERMITAAKLKHKELDS